MAFATGVATFQSNSANLVGARSFAPTRSAAPAQAQAAAPNARDFFAEMLQVFSALQRQFAAMAGDQQTGSRSDSQADAQRAASSSNGSGFPGDSNNFSPSGSPQTSDQQADAQRAAASSSNGSGSPGDRNNFEVGGTQPTADQQAAAQQQAADNQSSGFAAD